jgi:uncharacterized damage-inducible protein DinB
MGHVNQYVSKSILLETYFVLHSLDCIRPAWQHCQTASLIKEFVMDQQTQSQPDRPEGDLPLVALFRHNLWANLRLLDACAALNEQQLAATTAGTYGPIYNTLRHIVAAEQGYLRRLSGRQPETPLQPEDNPDVAALRDYARHTGEGLIAIAASAAPADVVPLEWDDQQWPVPASLILTQAINHATEHRAQVMTILTQQGVEPPDLSAWAYIEEHVTPTTEVG